MLLYNIIGIEIFIAIHTFSELKFFLNCCIPALYGFGNDNSQI